MHEDDVDRVVFVPLLWLAVIAGFFLLLRQRRVGAPCGLSNHAHARLMTAEEILDRRFAAGEIAEDEYRTRRAALREKLPAG